MTDDGPRIVRAPIALDELRELARLRYGDMVKACVDIGRSVEPISTWIEFDAMSTSARLTLAAGRWQTLSLMEQLGNVGSDVDRALRAHRDGRQDRFAFALDRALELFDLTATDPRWTLPQRREILRAREQFCRVFYDPTAEPDLAAYLSKYFLPFAVAARRG